MNCSSYWSLCNMSPVCGVLSKYISLLQLRKSIFSIHARNLLEKETTVNKILRYVGRNLLLEILKFFLELKYYEQRWTEQHWSPTIQQHTGDRIMHTRGLPVPMGTEGRPVRSDPTDAAQISHTLRVQIHPCGTNGTQNLGGFKVLAEQCKMFWNANAHVKKNI